MEDSNIKDNIKYMSSEEKYELENRLRELDIITDKDIEVLQILSYDKESIIRADAAEILVNSGSPEAEKILIRLLQDKNGLVRTCACESLYYSNSLEVVNLLVDILNKDKTELVRGYAAISIANILINTNKVDGKYINFFESMLKKEKLKWVKINIFQALYTLGKSEYLYKILDELKNKHYIKRALVSNLVVDDVTDDNRELIVSALKEALKKEETIAAKSSIESALKDICAE